MTFTSSQMSQARYTTRGTTLDVLDNVAEELAALVGQVVNAPADGLSIAEAHAFYMRAQAVERNARTFSQLVSLYRPLA